MPCHCHLPTSDFLHRWSRRLQSKTILLFTFCLPFPPFSCLSTLTQSVWCLIEVVKVDALALLLIAGVGWGGTYSILPRNSMLMVGFHQIEEVLFYSQSTVSDKECTLGFVKCCSCVYWDDTFHWLIFQMLNQLYIPGINPTGSQCTSSLYTVGFCLLIFLLRIFAPIFMWNTGP